jgi:hypothetical protein
MEAWEWKGLTSQISKMGFYGPRTCVPRWNPVRCRPSVFYESHPSTLRHFVSSAIDTHNRRVYSKPINDFLSRSSGTNSVGFICDFAINQVTGSNKCWRCKRHFQHSTSVFMWQFYCRGPLRGGTALKTRCGLARAEQRTRGFALQSNCSRCWRLQRILSEESN